MATLTAEGGAAVRGSPITRVMMRSAGSIFGVDPLTSSLR
jgi:hypothetical protein